MNKDQVKGEAKNIAGKAQEELGKLVGSKEQQAKGLSRHISGKVQKVSATPGWRLGISTSVIP